MPPTMIDRDFENIVRLVNTYGSRHIDSVAESIMVYHQVIVWTHKGHTQIESPNHILTAYCDKFNPEITNDIRYVYGDHNILSKVAIFLETIR